MNQRKTTTKNADITEEKLNNLNIAAERKANHGVRDVIAYDNEYKVYYNLREYTRCLNDDENGWEVKWKVSEIHAEDIQILSGLNKIKNDMTEKEKTTKSYNQEKVTKEIIEQSIYAAGFGLMDKLHDKDGKFVDVQYTNKDKKVRVKFDVSEKKLFKRLCNKDDKTKEEWEFVERYAENNDVNVELAEAI